mmetsp:Transcript_39953/g.66757  ORF Transcript_39953/g.66757 Transcript_39953/m.66757 type:complete len:303 (+) Transcript_39953:39-947(+)
MKRARYCFCTMRVSLKDPRSERARVWTRSLKGDQRLLIKRSEREREGRRRKKKKRNRKDWSEKQKKAGEDEMKMMGKERQRDGGRSVVRAKGRKLWERLFFFSFCFCFCWFVGGRRADLVGVGAQDVARHALKALLDVGRVLGGGLKERDLEFTRKRSSLVSGDDTVGLAVGLVANEEGLDVGASKGLDLLQPLGNVVERLLHRDVVDHDDSVCTAVITRRNCSEAFLAGCVPDLQTHTRGIDVDGTGFKVDSDGADKVVCEDRVRKLEEKARFTDTRVADDEEFEEVVIISVLSAVRALCV